MRNNKIKSFIVAIILCILIYVVYTTVRDNMIIKQNQNYEVEEFVFDENLNEIK